MKKSRAEKLVEQAIVDVIAARLRSSTPCLEKRTLTAARRTITAYLRQNQDSIQARLEREALKKVKTALKRMRANVSASFWA